MSNLRPIALSAAVWLAVFAIRAQDLSTNAPAQEIQQNWNFHSQNTDIVQFHPGISSPYAGPNNGISKVHQDFFAAAGLGILAGDGVLTYGWEQIIETYYDLQVWKTVHVTLDYQFVNHPAFNRDRGPVSVLGARLHWTF